MDGAQEQKDIELFLVVGVVDYVMVPLLMRTGLVDLAEKGLRAGVQQHTSALNDEKDLPKDSLGLHVDRTRVWIPPLPKAERDREEQKKRLSKVNNFERKFQILSWMAKRHEQHFAPEDVSRALGKNLRMARREMPGLLRVYKELGYVIEPEPGRFQAAGPAIRIPVEDYEVRTRVLAEFLSELMPLCESYLLGDAGAIVARASLPAPIWRELRRRLGEVCMQVIQEAVQASEAAGESGQSHRAGAVTVLAGTSSWRPSK